MPRPLRNAPRWTAAAAAVAVVVATGTMPACAHGDGGARPRPAPPVDAAGVRSPPLELAAGGPAPGSPPPAPPPSGTGPGTLVPPDHVERVRVDLTQVRGNPLEPEVRRFLEAIPAWARLLQGTGFDPIVEVDRLLFASPRPRSRAWMLVLRLTRPIDPARLRPVIEAYAAPRPVRFTRSGGVTVGRWDEAHPGASRAVILPAGGAWALVAPGEDAGRLAALVDRPALDPVRLTPDETLARALEPVRQAGDPDPPEAESPAPPGLRVVSRPRRSSGAGWGPDPPLRSVATGRLDEGGGVHLAWRPRYGEPTAAANALGWLRARHRSMVGHPVVGLLGLREPLEAARFEEDEDGLGWTVRLALTARQAALFLRFLTPLLLNAL